jgi:hypothetical protein
MHTDTRFAATQEILGLITRAVEGLTPILKENGVDASGVLINPRLKLASLKAAHEYVHQAIAKIERK